MTDPGRAGPPAPNPLAIERVEWSPFGTGALIVRVRGRWRHPPDEPRPRPVLHVRGEHREFDFPPLPETGGPSGADGGLLVSFAVPSELEDHLGSGMELEVDGARLPLGTAAPALSDPPTDSLTDRPDEELNVVGRAELAERRARRAEEAEEAERRRAGQAEELASQLSVRLARLEGELEKVRREPARARQALAEREREMEELRRRVAAAENAAAAARARLESGPVRAAPSALRRERAGARAAIERTTMRRRRASARREPGPESRVLATERRMRAAAPRARSGLDLPGLAERVSALRGALGDVIRAVAAERTMRARSGPAAVSAPPRSGVPSHAVVDSDVESPAAVEPAEAPEPRLDPGRLTAALTRLREEVVAPEPEPEREPEPEPEITGTEPHIAAAAGTPTPWLARGLRELAREDSVAAGRVLLAELPLLHRVAPDGLSFVLRPSAHEPALSVVVGADRTQVQMIDAIVPDHDRPRIDADPARLARYATARVAARHGLSATGAGRRTRRRARRALRDLARARLSLADLVAAGATLDPTLLWRLVIGAIDPDWTAHERFAIAHIAPPPAPDSEAARTVVRFDYGRIPAVGPEEPHEGVAATLHATPTQLLRMLAGRPTPDGAPALRIDGDATVVSALTGWIARLEGRDPR